MNLTNRVCTRCKEDKLLSEFYKQKDRHESLCKTCKKSSRGKRVRPTDGRIAPEALSPIGQTVVPTVQKLPFDFSAEVMPQFDESIFYPERRFAALGLDEDDVAELVGFLRWHLDQRDKRLKNK